MSTCSTNMAIQDAGALGECLAGHKEDVQAALQLYQKQRLAATTQEVEVLCSESQSTPLPFKAVPCAVSPYVDLIAACPTGAVFAMAGANQAGHSAAQSQAPAGRC